MSLPESEITVETVDQNLERVLQRMVVALFLCICRAAHLCLRFESKRPQISQQMAKDLELVAHRKTIELQHDRRIKRCDVAMPDIVRDAGEKDISVAAFE